MSSPILIYPALGLSGDAQPLEIVERKGRGHPDTICDAIAESVSVHLSSAYRKTFGRILHHNIDKCLLVAGQVHMRFGGGKVTHPMRLILGDRATCGLPGITIPVSEIAIEAARNWIGSHLPHVHPDTHVTYQIELQPTSAELGAIFEHDSQPFPVPANDTSAGVGYAPLTPIEQLVLDVERYINGTRFKQVFPETGEDVKVMAVRRERNLAVTIAVPFLATRILTEKNYFTVKGNVQEDVQKFIREQAHGCRQVAVDINHLDRPDEGLKGLYLTLLGISAEQGDSGQVGRGNQVSGVISANRPRSGEAVAGKNPRSHVGKIYNVMAQEIARRAYSRIDGIRDITIWMVSTIGTPVDQPQIVSAQVGVNKGYSLKRLSGELEELIRQELKDMGTLCDALVKGQIRIY